MSDAHLKANTVSKTQSCPICLSPVKFMPRYPLYVCISCKKRTTNELGKLVKFYQKISKTDILGAGSMSGHYEEDRTDYNSVYCWIDGVKCKAEIGRFGGIVIQKIQGNLKDDKRSSHEE